MSVFGNGRSASLLNLHFFVFGLSFCSLQFRFFGKFSMFFITLRSFPPLFIFLLFGISLCYLGDATCIVSLRIL